MDLIIYPPKGICIAFFYYLVPDRKPVFGRLVEERMLTKLPICKAQKILKPECTVVQEASFIIWQDFATTPHMGEFSFKHYLILPEYQHLEAYF